MTPSLVPPRRVLIGDAAAFVGTTPRAIRHWHALGLLPEPERGTDGRRRYGHDDLIRLLWIRRTADAGVTLDEIRDAFAGAAAPGGGDGAEVAVVLARLEDSLAEQEATLRRRRTALGRLRTRGSRLGLLSDVVASRLEDLPAGSVRQEDLDTLLVTERMLGPWAAAVQSTRFVALATWPELRREADRVDAAEEALDDAVAVDDPRVARVAAERHAFEEALHARIEESGLGAADEALLDAVDAEVGADGAGPSADPRVTSAAEAVSRMPYDWSPARVRSHELALRLPPAAEGTGTGTRTGGDESS